jgi:hypothetical protein
VHLARGFKRSRSADLMPADDPAIEWNEIEMFERLQMAEKADRLGKPASNRLDS